MEGNAAENRAKLTNSIQELLQAMDLKKPILSTLAQKGDEKLVEMFMGENVKFGDGASETAQNQLYMASFWGLHDVVRTLLDNRANPNGENPATKWTPLHAAAFLEHGKVIMLLLEKGADPNKEDFAARAPKDFASASDKIWSLFAAHGCKRTTKQELVDKRVLAMQVKKFNSMPSWVKRIIISDYLPSNVPSGTHGRHSMDCNFSSSDANAVGRRSTAASLLRFEDEQPSPGLDSANGYNAALNGDVLAGSESTPPSFVNSKVTGRNKGNEALSFSAWRS
eukprot:gene3507-4007_t